MTCAAPTPPAGQPPPSADTPRRSLLAEHCARYGEDLAAARRRIQADRERDQRMVRAMASGGLYRHHDAAPRRLTADDVLGAIRRRPEQFAEALAWSMFEQLAPRITDTALAVAQEFTVVTDFIAQARERARAKLAAERNCTNGHAGQAGTLGRELLAPELWAPPVPLSRPGDVPIFPTRVLPGWLAEWVLAEADATQTPPDLAGNLALAIAGAALARKVRVRIRDGWAEPANIFSVVSLPPGDRKSAVFADATAPLLEYEQAEQERMAPIIAELASEHRVMEAKLKGLEAKAAKAEDATEAHRLRQEATELAKELAQHAVPDTPQLFCDDVTPEKLTQLIVRQGGRMLLASAEGTAFEIAKGRYSESANFDVFLKGHAGDPLRTGRVGRETESVNQPALSCALAVQPDVIRGLSEQATMRGRGFLARWLYAIPASRVGKRKTAPPAVPEVTVQRYTQGMLALWRLPNNTLAGNVVPWELELSHKADEALRELERWLEPQLAEGEPLSHLAGWGNKLAGTVARLGLILHVAAGVSGTWVAPIDEKTIEAAAALGRDYYLPHARAAFGLMGADERSKDAARVIGWLVARLKCETVKACKGVVTVTKRDIHAEVFGGSRTVEQVDAVCRLLVEHGFLRPASPARRRDSHLFEVNPNQGAGDGDG